MAAVSTFSIPRRSTSRSRTSPNWNGQTSGEWAFSVAQHCLLVEDLIGRLKPEAPAEWRLAALLHDAPEYVIGDLITPFKAAVGLDYRHFEKRLLSAIHIRFGVPRQRYRKRLHR